MLWVISNGATVILSMPLFVILAYFMVSIN